LEADLSRASGARGGADDIVASTSPPGSAQLLTQLLTRNYHDGSGSLPRADPTASADSPLGHKPVKIGRTA
jgi:hypothetical protein